MRLFLALVVLVSLVYAKVGTVTRLQGSADLRKAVETITVKEGLDVSEQETLLTHQRSKAMVRLLDATMITVGPESEFRFVAFDSGDDPHTLMQIKRGFFKAVTGRIGKIAPERFQVKTNEATIGIRGTWFMGHIEPKREAIGCSKGAITVTTADRTFVVEAGQMVIFEEGIWRIEPLSYPRFAPVLGFDEGLDALTDDILDPIDTALMDEASSERDAALEPLSGETPKEELEHHHEETLPPTDYMQLPTDQPVDTTTDSPATNYNDYYTP